MGFHKPKGGRNMALTVPVDSEARRQPTARQSRAIDDEEGTDMTINVKVTRDEVLRIKVAPDILRRLEALALRFGLPSSTLAAYAIAQWLAQQEQGANMVEAVAREIGGNAGEMLEKLLELVEFERKPDA